MMIKAIFFDTSDTLYHSDSFKEFQRNHPINQLAKQRNISFEEAKKLFQRTRESLKSKMVHVPKVAVMMELGISRMQMHEELSKVNPKEFLTPDNTLKLILTRLHLQYELGIITNILQSFLEKVLGALLIDIGTFNHIVTIDITKNSKPHQEPFMKAIELSQSQPEQCVYVGDSLTKDIIPAKQVGMKTVWITKEPKVDSHVDVQISSVYEIEKAILKINDFSNNHTKDY